MTSEAREITARMIAEHLQGGEMLVSGDGSEARAPLEVQVDGTTVLTSGTFGEHEANFAWMGRSILDSDGVTWDAVMEELGAKREGAVWTIDVPIDVPDADLVT